EGHFYEDDSTCFERRYDLVLASASIHYVEDWKALLARLGGATRRFLLVTRLPVVLQVPSYVAVQRPRRHGFHTEYRGWVIRRGELLAHAESLGLELDREFLIAERPRIARAPESCRYRGFLFRPPRSSRS